LTPYERYGFDRKISTSAGRQVKHKGSCPLEDYKAKLGANYYRGFQVGIHTKDVHAN